MTTKPPLPYMQPTLKEMITNFQIKKCEKRKARKLVSIFASFGKAWIMEDTHLLFAYTYLQLRTGTNQALSFLCFDQGNKVRKAHQMTFQ